MENNLGLFTEKTKINKFRWAMFIIAGLTIISWFAWMIVDVIFVTKGVHIEFIIWEEVGVPSGAQVVTDELYQNASQLFATIYICMLSICIFMEAAYIIIKLRNVKSNLYVNVYEIVVHFIVAVGLLGFWLKSTDMLRKDEWLLYVPVITNIYDISGIKSSLSMAQFYHFDFLNYTAAALAFIIISGVTILTADKKALKLQNVMQDLNLIIIVLAVIILLMLPVILVLAAPGSEELVGEIDWDHTDKIFLHAGGAMLSQPLGTLLGAIMCLLFLRLACVCLLPKEQIKARAIVPLSILFFLVSALFIATHVFKLDIYKFITNQLYSMIVLVFSVETTFAVLAAIFAIISINKYLKGDLNFNRIKAKGLA